LLIYAASLALYVSVLSALVNWCLQSPVHAVVLFGMMLATWLKLRKGRIENWQVGQLEFEEAPEAAVLTLSIERD
jgi:hypothetical protein